MVEITQMVLAVDTNANMAVDLGELNDLTLRIALALELRGIKLDAERFRAIIRSDNSICHVLNGKPMENLCAHPVISSLTQLLPQRQQYTCLVTPMWRRRAGR